MRSGIQAADLGIVTVDAHLSFEDVDQIKRTVGQINRPGNAGTAANLEVRAHRRPVYADQVGRSYTGSRPNFWRCGQFTLQTVQPQ